MTLGDGEGQPEVPAAEGGLAEGGGVLGWTPALVPPSPATPPQLGGQELLPQRNPAPPTCEPRLSNAPGKHRGSPLPRESRGWRTARCPWSSSWLPPASALHVGS